MADDIIKVIDFLAGNFIKEINKPSHFKINALLYMLAITAKEHLNDLKEIPKQCFIRLHQCGWIILRENYSIKKKIGQLTTLINCKNTNNFTNHQKEIKQKFYNKYGNMRMQTFQFKLTLLKQDFKATSIKLEWLKKTMWDKSSIVNLLVTSNQYTGTSRVAVSLWMKYQLKIKLKSFGRVFGKRRQNVIKVWSCWKN